MSYNATVTPKERGYLEDAMQMENLCITKCSVYADQCQNQAFKSFLFEHVRLKRRHADRLKELLGRQPAPGRQQYH